MWPGQASSAGRLSRQGSRRRVAAAAGETNPSGTDEVAAAPHPVAPHDAWRKQAAQGFEVPAVHCGAIVPHCLLQLVGSVLDQIGPCLQMPFAGSLGSPPPQQQGCAPRLHRAGQRVQRHMACGPAV